MVTLYFLRGLVIIDAGTQMLSYPYTILYMYLIGDSTNIKGDGIGNEMTEWYNCPSANF